MRAHVAAGALLMGGLVAGVGQAAEAADPRYGFGLAVWDTDISGSVSDNERLDLEDDLALESDLSLIHI